MHRKRKILVLCPYPLGVAPSQRLKFEQYYGFFEREGYSLTISPFVSHSFWRIIYKKGNYFSKIWYTIGGYMRRVRDIFRINSYDIVYIHLWVTPLGPPVFERLARWKARRIVFDIDDLVYLKDIKSKSSPLINKLKGSGKPIYLMKTADHVITCTPYLDSFVRNLNPRTTDISSTVDTDIYKSKVDYAITGKKLVLGWSGSLSTSKYLHLLTAILQKLRQQLDFKLIVMGDDSFTMDGVEVEAKKWDKDYELTVISSFDIGLYPLPDEEWVYGKSGLKAIQYMAMGIPTLASAIGANFRVIEDGKSGYLIEREEQWVSRIIELANSKDLREKIGRQARKKVEDEFSIKANEPAYLKVLAEVMAGPQ